MIVVTINIIMLNITFNFAHWKTYQKYVVLVVLFSAKYFILNNEKFQTNND